MPNRFPWLFLALLALSPLAACQQSPATSAAGAATGQTAAKIDQPANQPAASGEKLIEETWDAYSMQDFVSGKPKRVGYAHTTIANVIEEGREHIRTRNHVHTSMQRAGQTITQDMTLTSWDTADGRLVRFESRMAGGPGEMVSVGTVRDGQLGIDTTTLGRVQSQKIPWQAEWGGLFAPELSLRRSPLKPGEKRTVRGLLPVMNIPADTQLEALDFETVELPAGKVKLLKVNNIVAIGPQKIESIVWIDEKGDALKSVVPSLGQEAVRTTKADALQQPGGEQYDLLLASTVRLKGSLPNPRDTKRAVYRAHLKSGQITGLFADGLSQRVKPIDEQGVELTVMAIRPDSPAQLDKAQEPPTDADRSPNNFIQSDDRVIAEMASRIAPSAMDPWKVACAIERFVDATVQIKNFSSAFATAAEVARSLEGDCTEHGVLMAALCRARKIPARVAFGLVYYPPEKGFAYHMWNEVWINDRWVPMDATLALGGIGADHIKLGDSNLSGGSPLADLLSVIQVFGRLELEVLEAE